MRFLIAFVLVLIAKFSFAQDRLPKRLPERYKTFVGFGVGISSYLGDMGTGNPVLDMFNNGKLAGEVRVAYKHNDRFTTNAKFYSTNLRGDDLDTKAVGTGRRERGLNFKSKFYEISVAEEIHLFTNYLEKKAIPFSPYLSVGLTAFYYNPTTVASDGNTYELRKLGTEGQGAEGYAKKYSNFALGIPVGLGIKYYFNEKIHISIEGLARFTNTDYIDDVSTDYAPEDVLLANGGPIAVELSDRRRVPLYTGQRGSPSFNDSVLGLQLVFAYGIGTPRGAVKCPDIYKL